ncbi:MAG: DUF1109 domain-containing protein [Proteobacteria bacterium]|nr:DUF1109 domain-containing protein [Pseudomonadota bacterium]
MKTDELVNMLASGNVGVEPHAVERRFVLGLGLGSAASVALMVATLGVRPDLLEATRLPMFWFKCLFAASLALASLVMVARLSRPGMPLGRAPTATLSPLLVVWLLGALTLLVAAPEQRVALLFGATWTVCPLLIAMLALPLLAGALWAVSGLAPVNLRLAGAASGLLAGALATLVYCVHCPEMAPPFIAVWYALGIAMPTVLGVVIGPRVLRW